ncbi:MAG TPA: M56 family metallopeptidase [Verrucomicrobiae bacterium]|jgi:TonB family protein|nr:M56 family metallopeptidase [Verrucomicrobiae bacterium]
MRTFASSEPALAFLFACGIKATVLLVFAWIVAFALRNRSSAAERHHVWAAAILASLALPFFALVLPAWRSVTLGNAAGLWNPARASGASTSAHTIPSVIINVRSGSPIFNQLAVFTLQAWALGFSFIFLRLAAGLARLAWVSAHSRPLFDNDWMRRVLELSESHKISRSVRLLQCSSPLAMPLTWGISRPVIVLPSSAAHWDDERRRIVLSHELAHIARQDWFLQICAELARSIYWFHPLVWLAAARLRQESERASDDAVLLSGIAPSHYASQLLDLARTLENSGRAWSTALAIARPSNLERRFAAMLNPSIDRSRLSRRTKLFVPFFALFLLLPLATLHLRAQNLSGKVAGSIHDPSGSGVANATIIMSSHAANTIDMTTSDRDGNFSFKALPSGEYELKAMKPGFQVYRLPQVNLVSGSDFSQNISLEIATIMEEVHVVPAGTRQPLPVGTTGKPSRLRLGGDLEASSRITKVQPVYPDSAKSAGISGTVILHAVISKDGKPLSLRVMNGQIDPDLARSAVEAVSQWRYTPTLLNGEPIEVDTTITVIYSLESSN